MGAVTVVGGVYEEAIRTPPVRRMMGSGLRAAAVLRALGDEVRLITRIDDESRPELTALAGAYDVEVTADKRESPIGFAYLSPVDAPRVRGLAVDVSAPVAGVADVVLGFGMVEGPVRLGGEVVVVDPQHASLGENGISVTNADRAAIVVSQGELRRLTSTAEDDLATAARQLASAHGFQVVVVKRGALGALVVHDEGCEWQPAISTALVAPVGTGDVFSAAFAHAWGVEGVEPLAAAASAANATAWHATHDTPILPTGPLLRGQLPDGAAVGNWTQEIEAIVYLASPFFDLAETWRVELARRGLLDIGARVFSPLHDVDQVAGDVEIASADLTGLNSCDAVVALLDGADPGTLFEVGYAVRAGLPVVAFSAQPADNRWLMLRGSGVEVLDDLSTALYRGCWQALAKSAVGQGPT
ncbi:MAG: nucleoside 2-deoxyribosyltransferase [Frankiaceae bacterium]|nr:nucleoside 2-deoxyribosyltransferase [Frankiaceae bacterium]